MTAALQPGSLRQVIWCYCVLQACMGNVKRHSTRKSKAVHVNLIVPYVEQDVRVSRMVLVAEGDGCYLSAGRLVRHPLLEEQEKDIHINWAEILTEFPGKTNVLKHSINTGDHAPVRSAPYTISAAKWSKGGD